MGKVRENNLPLQVTSQLNIQKEWFLVGKNTEATI